MRGIKEILLSFTIGLAALTTLTFLTRKITIERAQVETKTPTQIAGSMDDPALSLSWGLQQIRAPKARARIGNSKMIVVAIIDTGADVVHPALRRNIWRNPGEAGLDENGQSKATNGLDDDDNGFGRFSKPEPIRMTDQYPIMVNDLPLPASKKPSAVFLKLIDSFDMGSIKPYDARFLASWPAEIYDVPMADASLDARSQTYKRYKRDMPSLINNANIVHMSSANLVIDSFKLNLLPVWMTELPFDGRSHLVLINGQNGVISSDVLGKVEKQEEEGGLFNFLSDLLGD